ncbi:MAG TPA: GrpB family protein [Candidatus Saccharimonadales bacterium]|nr:GrpB family protein [Candidatus Saccharimonadales bacterium]
MPSRYSFTEYSSQWPDLFTAEAAVLQGILGVELVSIHHIGSTAVPGLAAKPIIDLLPVVRNIGRIDELASALEAAGYKAYGEYGLPGRRYFTRDKGEYRTHNVHIFQQDDLDIERHLAFCAYLQAHVEARQDYATLKREVYIQHPADIEAYNKSKDAWIKQAELTALEWYRDRVSQRDCGWPIHNQAAGIMPFVGHRREVYKRM